LLRCNNNIGSDAGKNKNCYRRTRCSFNNIEIRTLSGRLGTETILAR
jgi:hypothetical protein